MKAPHRVKSARQFLLLLIACISIHQLSAQPFNEWTWVNGAKIMPLYGIYGTKGVSDPANKPGGRSGQATWTDASGNTWIFGGSGYGAAITGNLNDLWKYTVSTGQWTWVSGSQVNNGAAVYGTKGTAAAENVPGARTNATGSIDASGNLWLFGGSGALGFMNDVWKFDVAVGMWTWISGDNTGGQNGVYGTKGTGATTNKPGGRYSPTSWMDGSGNLWIFGGNGYPSSGTSTGILNDLWKFTPSSLKWTWMSGDNAVTQTGVYGSKGTGATTNKPGGRYGGISWTDTDGSLWLMGGYGNAASTTAGYLNDLWQYVPSSGKWAWVSGDNSINNAGVYGTKGTGATTNKPGGRTLARGAKDGSGNLWIFGGTGYGPGTSSGGLNDLWMYTPSSKKWTWISGDNTISQVGIYGTKGTGSTSNKPAYKSSSSVWFDGTGNLWLFGGQGPMKTTGNYNTNDVWKFSPSTAEWTWVSGDNAGGVPGVYSTKGVASPTDQPGGRFSPATWTDAAGDLWLFGGSGNDANGANGSLNDLWKYSRSTGQWTWMSGDSIVNNAGVYGTKGTAAAANKPGGRSDMNFWVDASGDFWLMGGVGLGSSGNGYLNDLWKYTLSTGMWTWVSGDATVAQIGVYGTKGVEGASGKPGGRAYGAGWAGDDNNFYVWGGYGYATSSSVYYLNDLWRFSPSSGQWTWVSGSNTTNATGVYGNKGVEDAANTPGARQTPARWKGKDGNLWLYSGIGYGFPAGYGVGSDLWKFSPTSGKWTWVSGDMTTNNQQGVYGTKGVPDTADMPGGRQSPVTWTDATGSLWLLGGSGYTVSGQRSMNDWWSYNPSVGKWTWMGGDSTGNSLGAYAAQGTADVTNQPGARISAATWTDGDGTLWMLGGSGYAANISGNLNDLWSVQAQAPVTLPVKLLNFTGRWKTDQTVQLYWATAMEQNSKQFLIQRSATGGDFITIGTIPATGAAARYAYTDAQPLSKNYYRLKIVDLDGSATYSTVVVLTRGARQLDGRILSNPVIGNLRLQVTMAIAGAVNLTVSNAAGKLLYSGSRTIGAGVNLITLPAAYNAGYYIVRISEAGESLTIPFVVTNH